MVVGVTKPDLPDLQDYVERLAELWDSSMITNNGKFVRELTAKLKEYLQVKNLVLVNNGTSALQLALRALKVKGEVITTPFTFAATTNILVWEGIKPIFADIDRETFNISPRQIERCITPKTSAILAVHAYGNPPDIPSIQKIAEDYGLKVIYDAAQSFNVRFKGKSILDYGDASTLSFHATKTFHTIEGGAISTAKEELVRELELMRNHGIESEECVKIPGINAKMDEFQAIMGLLNLERADKNISKRKKIYNRYLKELNEIVNFQRVIAEKYNYGYFPIILGSMRERNNLYEQLKSRGFLPRKYFYPLTSDFDYMPNSNSKIFINRNLPNARYISERALCLPIFPDLSEEIIQEIIAIVKKEVSALNIIH